MFWEIRVFFRSDFMIGNGFVSLKKFLMNECFKTRLVTNFLLLNTFYCKWIVISTSLLIFTNSKKVSLIDEHFY